MRMLPLPDLTNKGSAETQWKLQCSMFLENLLGNNSSSYTRVLKDRLIHMDFRVKAQDGLQLHLLSMIMCVQAHHSVVNFFPIEGFNNLISSLLLSIDSYLTYDLELSNNFMLTSVASLTALKDEITSSWCQHS